MRETTGSFTLPGEAGYEELTLKLAKKWGADVIRDSDGTVLSDEITKAGYGIYSTICIIRDHNEWAKKHPDKLQQSFLMSDMTSSIVCWKFVAPLSFMQVLRTSVAIEADVLLISSESAFFVSVWE